MSKYSRDIRLAVAEPADKRCGSCCLALAASASRHALARSRTGLLPRPRALARALAGGGAGAWHSGRRPPPPPPRCRLRSRSQRRGSRTSLRGAAPRPRPVTFMLLPPSARAPHAPFVRRTAKPKVKRGKVNSNKGETGKVDRAPCAPCVTLCLCHQPGREAEAVEAERALDT